MDAYMYKTLNKPMQDNVADSKYVVCSQSSLCLKCPGSQQQISSGKM